MERFLDFIKSFRDRVISFLNQKQISERDRRAFKFAIWAVVIFFGFMVFKWIFIGKDVDRRRVFELRKQLHQVRELRSEYEYSKDLLKRLTASIKREEEALISVVEKVLVDNRIQRTLFSIKDSNTKTDKTGEFYEEKAVEVDVKKITLQKALDILYSMQTRDSFLKVSDVKLKTRFGEENLLDLSFRLSTFEFKT